MASPRRERFRVGLSGLYEPYYGHLCVELPPEWQPYWGIRDFHSQDELYAKGRTVEPIGKGFEVTNAQGGESPHQYGCATDWTVFESGKPIWMHKDDVRWSVYLDAIKKAGLRPGAEWGDFYHNELPITCKYKEILPHYKSGGMKSAQDAIKWHLTNGEIQ